MRERRWRFWSISRSARSLDMLLAASHDAYGLDERRHTTGLGQLPSVYNDVQSIAKESAIDCRCRLHQSDLVTTNDR